MMAVVASRYQLAAYDIKGVFLNSKIDESTYVYVTADKDLSKWFIDKYPHLQSQVNRDAP
jgi:hypothetical protein